MRIVVVSLCFIALSCVDSWSIEPDDAALVGVWLCDEGTGEEILDSSGNNNHATGTFEWAEGKFDGGIAVSQGSIDVPTSDSVNSIIDGITVAAWFRVEEDSDTGIRRNNAYLLEDQAGGEQAPNSWVFAVWTPGIVLAWGDTEVEQGEWTHIAGTYDGQFVRLYINGEMDEEVEGAGPIQTPADPLQLKYAPETYVGGMDEIIILSRALDGDEIRQLMKGWSSAFAMDSQDRLAITWGTLKFLHR